jgi:cytidine diphosphoramidate kinase
MIIWMIGLSGAGKTTIGRHVYSQWKDFEPNTVFVDGDEIRELFKHDQRPDSHTVAGRQINADRITELCLWLDRQDINVVCCILSIFPEMRACNRVRFSRYFEVCVSVPMETLINRDVKNLYVPALKGEISDVVGIDIPFPEPTSSDLVLDNSVEGKDPRELARRILDAAGLAP